MMEPTFYGSDFLSEDAEISSALSAYDETAGETAGIDADGEAVERYLSAFEASADPEYPSDWEDN